MATSGRAVALGRRRVHLLGQIVERDPASAGELGRRLRVAHVALRHNLDLLVSDTSVPGHLGDHEWARDVQAV